MRGGEVPGERRAGCAGAGESTASAAGKEFASEGRDGGADDDAYGCAASADCDQRAEYGRENGGTEDAGIAGADGAGGDSGAGGQGGAADFQRSVCGYRGLSIDRAEPFDVFGARDEYRFHIAPGAGGFAGA